MFEFHVLHKDTEAQTSPIIVYDLRSLMQIGSQFSGHSFSSISSFGVYCRPDALPGHGLTHRNSMM